MKVQQQQDGQDGSFFIEEKGHRVAESRYTLNGNEMDIYHTQVAQEYQGAHLGDQLIEAAVNHARTNHLTVTPSCSFAQAMFGRHKEYGDVLAKS